MAFEHNQCYECGRITGGPFKEPEDEPPKQPGRAYHIDSTTGKAYTEGEAHSRGLPFNISHGMCKNCLRDYKAMHEPLNNWKVTLRKHGILPGGQEVEVNEQEMRQEGIKREAAMRVEGQRRREQMEQEGAERAAAFEAENAARSATLTPSPEPQEDSPE